MKRIISGLAMLTFLSVGSGCVTLTAQSHPYEHLQRVSQYEGCRSSFGLAAGILFAATAVMGVDNYRGYSSTNFDSSLVVTTFTGAVAALVTAQICSRKAKEHTSASTQKESFAIELNIANEEE